MHPVKIGLAIDGGGIKGVVALKWIDWIEHYLARPVIEYVHIVAGTSTGGVIVGGLSAHLRVKDMRQFYFDSGPEIFAEPRSWFGQLFRPKYDGQALARTLQNYLHGLSFGEAILPTVVTAYDLDKPGPKYFKSWDEPDMGLPYWKPLYATSAAPTFFSPIVVRGHRYSDGGVGAAGNPTMCLLAEMKRLWPLSPRLVISMGNGDARRGSFDIGKGGKLGWAKAIVSVFLDGDHDTTDYQAQREADLLPDGEVGYRRFQFVLPAGVSGKMDDAELDNMRKLERAAEKYVEQNRAHFEETVHLLKKYR